MTAVAGEPKDRPDLTAVRLLLAEKGKCSSDPDPDRWWQPLPHPTHDGDSTTLARDRAAELCDGCPVLDRCRWYALEAGEDDGVWGGLSEIDRASMRRGSSWRSRIYARSHRVGSGDDARMSAATVAGQPDLFATDLPQAGEAS